MDRKIKGYKSHIKGLYFEDKVLNYFYRKGWKVSKRRKDIIPPREIDVFGVIDLPPPKKYLLVECKDKEIVTANDVIKFINKVDDFKMKYGYSHTFHNVFAVMAYTNKVDREAKKVAQRHGIRFLKFR